MDKEAKKAEKLRQGDKARRTLELREILKIKAGRSFLWDLMGDCKVFQTTYTGDNLTYYLEGTRSVGLKLLTEILDADKEAYFKMVRENEIKEFEEPKK